MITLVESINSLTGKTIAQLADEYNLTVPNEVSKRKGFLGLIIEKALGTTAGTRALPDFVELGIELKTLPISANQRVSESTFITTISLQTLNQETFETSTCYKKLNHILWIPVEGDKLIHYPDRRIGRGFFWKPSLDDLEILKRDWTELTDLIRMGQINAISSHLGEYLQVRPKGQDAKSLCNAYGEEGEVIKTLPRGFYLRAAFTNKIYEDHLTSA